MISKRLICVLILTNTWCTYGHAQTIAGGWREISVPQTGDMLMLHADYKRAWHWIFHTDSTFVIVGAYPKEMDTVPGWHGELIEKGKWKLTQKERLELYYENFPTTMTYKIIRLNKNELYLQYYVPSFVPQHYILKFERVSPL